MDDALDSALVLLSEEGELVILEVGNNTLLPVDDAVDSVRMRSELAELELATLSLAKDDGVLLPWGMTDGTAGTGEVKGVGKELW